MAPKALLTAVLTEAANLFYDRLAKQVNGSARPWDTL